MESEARSVQEVRCPHCGKDALSTDLYCPHCDLPLDWDFPVQPPARTPTAGWWLVGLGTVLALLGMWMWLLMSFEIPGIMLPAVITILIGDWITIHGFSLKLQENLDVVKLLAHDRKCLHCGAPKPTSESPCPQCGALTRYLLTPPTKQSYVDYANMRAWPLTFITLLGVGFLSLAVVMAFNQGSHVWNWGFVIIPGVLSMLLLGFAARLFKLA